MTLRKKQNEAFFKSRVILGALLTSLFLINCETKVSALFNDVVLSSSTISVGGFNVVASGQIEGLVTRLNDFDVVLLPGSSFVVVSSNKKDFAISVSGQSTHTEICNVSNSSLVFTAPAVRSTSTISIVGNCGGSSAPAQVSNVMASPGNSQVMLSWPIPVDGGSLITDYLIEFKLNTSPSYSVFNDGVSNVPSATVTGLLNGSLYNFRISAINGIGTGLPSLQANSQPASVSSVPSAPLLVSAVAGVSGNAIATISFLPPLTQGLSPVTSYTAISSPSSLIVSGASSPLVVAGLTYGVAYTFNVTASNASGTGPASSPSNSVVPPPPSASGGVYSGTVAATIVGTTGPAGNTPLGTTPSTTNPVSNTPNVGITVNSNIPPISSFLVKGSRSNDVRSLQQILIRESLLKVTPNDKLGLFGDKTLAAVKEFQCRYKIVCSGVPSKTGWGVVGTRTKNVLNQVRLTPSPVLQAGETSKEIRPNISLGSRNKHVIDLQKVLIKEGALKIGPNDLLGIYGSKTEIAVKTFQCKYNIVCSGTSATTGWGSVSENTWVVVEDKR